MESAHAKVVKVFSSALSETVHHTLAVEITTVQWIETIVVAVHLADFKSASALG